VVPVGTLQFDTAGSSAVAITGLLAYRHGFEFFVTRLFRPVEGKTGPPNPGGPRRGEEPLKIGVVFADGGQAFTGGWVDMSYADEPDRPFVYPGGASPGQTGWTGAGGSGRCRHPADLTSPAGLEKPRHGSASKRSSSSTHHTEARRPGPTHSADA
jgi:hypothetical protein